MYTLMLLNFWLNIYSHVISTNFETGLPRYNLCIFWRGWNFVMLLVWSNHYETFVRTIFLKLCQKDNLCQSRETLKHMLIKINFTFSGGQMLRIFMKLSQITVLKRRTSFLKLCQNYYIHEILTSLETGLTRYNVCTLIPQLSTYLWFSPS